MNLNELADSFDEVIDSATNRLSEEKFKQLFLPYFLGEKYNENIIVKWTEIAGSPQMPVHLIDEEGQVVNTVPPLIKGGLFNNGEDVDSLIAQGKLKEETFGVNREYNKLKMTLVDKVEELENVDEWAKALSKYVDTSTINTEEVHDEESYDDDFELDFS